MARTTIAGIVKFLAPVLVPCNLFVIFAGIYTILVPSGGLFGIILDAMILFTLVSDIVLIVMVHPHLNYKRNEAAARIHWLLSAFLIGLSFLVIGGVMVTLATMLVADPANAYYVVVVCTGIAATVLPFTFMARASYKLHVMLRLDSEKKPDAGDAVVFSMNAIVDEPAWVLKPNVAKVIKVIGISFLFLVFALSIYAPLVFFTGGADVPAWIAGDLAGTLVMLLVPSTAMLARYVPRNPRPGNKALLLTFLIAGCTLACVNSVPLFRVSETVASVNAQFQDAYGTGWETRLPATAPEFRASPFLFKDELFTMSVPRVDVELDVEYMVDNGTSLKFDWYAPAGTKGTTLKFPLVIALHPGSWQFFDKGVANMMPVSRHLAGRGFIIVDVQYGLYPDFTIQDMINEIGNLTKFLAVHQDEYNTNLSSTFFLGRSAGAHLAMVSGLGLNRPYFSGTFEPTMQCKGIIQYYGPTNMSGIISRTPGMIGAPEDELFNYDPLSLVEPGAPPVLSIQGDADRLVPPQHALALETLMEENNNTCITAVLPHAGHAFDAFYNYHFNQVSIYFIERFLALEAS